MTKYMGSNNFSDIICNFLANAKNVVNSYILIQLLAHAIELICLMVYPSDKTEMRKYANLN